jgi:hypothetical protein
MRHLHSSGSRQPCAPAQASSAAAPLWRLHDAAPTDARLRFLGHVPAQAVASARYATGDEEAVLHIVV